MCGDYEIIADIDSGSYGQVKLAKDLDGQQVAIKLIDAEKVVKQKKERHVQREKDLLFKLKHQHIIKIYKTFKWVSAQLFL